MQSSVLKQVEELRLKRLYVQIQYFNGIREFHTVHTVIKKVAGNIIETVNGDIIDTSLIASIDGDFLPGYEHMDDFTCDC